MVGVLHGLVCGGKKGFTLRKNVRAIERNALALAFASTKRKGGKGEKYKVSAVEKRRKKSC